MQCFEHHWSLALMSITMQNSTLVFNALRLAGRVGMHIALYVSGSAGVGLTHTACCILSSRTATQQHDQATKQHEIATA
jgi:hypothetical protein